MLSLNTSEKSMAHECKKFQSMQVSHVPTVTDQKEKEDALTVQTAHLILHTVIPASQLLPRSGRGSCFIKRGIEEPDHTLLVFRRIPTLTPFTRAGKLFNEALDNEIKGISLHKAGLCKYRDPRLPAGTLGKLIFG
jgi:hypothetical protein